MKIFTLSIILFSLAGCSISYYGYTKSEWQRLSAEDQEKAKEEYSNVLGAKNTMLNGDPVDKAAEDFIERAANTEPRQ